MYNKYKGVMVFMSLNLLVEMSTQEKVDFLFTNADKKFLRKFCGVSPSKFMMLEISGEQQFKKFLAGRVNKLSNEEFYEITKKLA